MKPTDAYPVLARELEEWRKKSYAALIVLVDQPATAKMFRVNTEYIAVEVCIKWEDPHARSIRVEAIAYGPSNFRLERLEEAIVVFPEDLKHA